MERRLAAILAADVVGYSRLMGDDEEGTLARLKVYRKEIIDAGDGVPSLRAQREAYRRRPKRATMGHNCGGGQVYN